MQRPAGVLCLWYSESVLSLAPAPGRLGGWRVSAATRVTRMPSARSDEVRDYAFGDRVLALRKRAGLTQAAWAALLGAGTRTVEGWEAGTAYPSVERLSALIGVALERGLFTPGG